MRTPHKAFMMLMQKFQHIYQNIFRIDADGNNRIDANGNQRVTADSDY